MIKTKKIVRQKYFVKQILPVFLIISFAPSFTLANENMLWDMSLEELVQVRVTSIASGTHTPLDKAAAVVSVITEDDIHAMGATDLNEVLETVPGLHVNRSTQAFTPNFTFRGITSIYNAQTLVMINDVPVSSIFTGNKNNAWGGMAIKAIKRIEVIRGPGSALYGADAFAGVVNIITKSRSDIDGTESGIRMGSFDTKSSWLQHGGTYNNYDVALSLEYQSTDGWKEIIDADGIGNSGPVSTGVDATDIRIDITKGDWTLHAGYQGRRDLGLAAGLAQVLDPDGAFDSDRINVDSRYLFKDVMPELDIESQIAYNYNAQIVATNPTLFPDIFPGFPDGVIGAPGYKEHQVHFNINSHYDGFSGHFIRAGVGGFWGDIFETTELKNFDQDFSQSPPFIPKGGLVDVSDTADVFLPEKDRKSYHLFIQDEWQFADNWALTSGLRYDHYSDFGGTTNPRLALVWATTDNITTKLLYGRAFRAPAMVELFAIANPVSLGNPDLDPEIINSYEFALAHQISTDFLYRTNLFYYDIKDYIEVTGIPGELAQNLGKRKGQGAELEFEYSALPTLKLLGNYAFQKSKDKESNEAVGEAPNHQVHVRAEWQASEKWLLTPQLNWVGKQRRVDGDARKPTSSYATVDLTIRQYDVVQNLDISLSIHNFFDRDVFEPSPNGVPAPSIPNDFPMAGRSIYGEIAYSF